MKAKLIISGYLLLLGALLNAQTMIGLSKEEVAEKVKKEHREFRKDDSVIRQRFNYLKYVNSMRTRTWIIYFTDDNVCKSSKLVCDYADYNEMLEELNSKYKVAGQSLWEYEAGADTIRVELIKQEWYFTVRESRKD
jgi:uncharacterized protein (DUF169 family)